MANINLNPNQTINQISSQIDQLTNPTGAMTLTAQAPAGSSTAVVLNNAQAQASGKVVSFRTGGTEKAYIDWGGHLGLSYLDTTATVGAATANTACGKSKLASAVVAGTIVITNSLVSATSVVWAQIAQAVPDATATSIVAVVPTAGSFTVYFVAQATANVIFTWAVLS